MDLLDAFQRTIDGPGFGLFWRGPAAPSSVTPGAGHVESTEQTPRGDLMAHFGVAGPTIECIWSAVLLEPPTVGESTIAVHKDLGAAAWHAELVFRPNQPAHMQVPQVTFNQKKLPFPRGGNMPVPGISPGKPFSIHLLVESTRFRTKVWPFQETEPTDWLQDVQAPAQIVTDGECSIMVGHGDDEPITHHWDLLYFEATAT